MIDGYLERLSRRVRISEAIAFGSTVRGDRLKESDIDLIIISEDFAQMPFPERLGLLQLDWDNAPDLEAFGYTPDEFERFKNQTVILREAVRYGKQVYPKSSFQRRGNRSDRLSRPARGGERRGRSQSRASMRSGTLRVPAKDGTRGHGAAGSDIGSSRQ